MFGIRIRAIVGIMIFLGYFLIYIIRYNLSVHIVDMAQISKRDGNLQIMSKMNLSFYKWTKHSSTRSMIDLITWDNMKIGKLFSAYHIGYCVCFPIFHNIGDRIGPTWVVGIAGMISGILCCLTPAAAYYNFWVLFVVRIVEGFCAGAMQPSMVQVLRHWVPPIERNHFMWAYCGITTGTCSTFLLCAAVQFYARWPIGFYGSGGAQIVWAVLWTLIVSDNPRVHSFITKEELDYLMNTIGTIFTIKLTNSQAPWKLILKSLPFWALGILNFGYAWMIISLCIHGPLYYSRVMQYNIYNASALTALPFFIRLVLGTIVIQSFHWYKHSSKFKRVKHIRKYFIFFSHVVPGFILAVSWFFPVMPGPVLITIAVGLTAAGMDLTMDLCYALKDFNACDSTSIAKLELAKVAYDSSRWSLVNDLYTKNSVNIQEITPNFVNSLTTVIKIIGNTAGIIISLVVGKVTETHKNTPYIWKHIWCFHATVLFCSGVIFLIWGETEVQYWNYQKRTFQRKNNISGPQSSKMSNIIEVDEDNSSTKTSVSKYLQK